MPKALVKMASACSCGLRLHFFAPFLKKVIYLLHLG